jgi:hypothetical protein
MNNFNAVSELIQQIQREGRNSKALWDSGCVGKYKTKSLSMGPILLLQEVGGFSE